MIASFRHKGLKLMFEKGRVRLIDPSLRVRVANILAVLDAAASALDLVGPGNRLHELQGYLFRSPDGRLSPARTYQTGGIGTGAELGSQGSLVLSRNQRWLFAVDAGSSEISVFQVTGNGLLLSSIVGSGGSTPVSVAFNGRLLYVVNSGSDNIAGFRSAFHCKCGRTAISNEWPAIDC